MNITVQETFTNSAEFGIISQRDFFEHDVSKAENIGGYYIVREKDFVYNPRISTIAPVGPINCNKLGRNGVMSPLYTVFRTHDVDTTYLEWFFKSNYWHSFMYFNGDSGVRADRFSIKDAVFFEMPISLPGLEEQNKIGIWMNNIDNLFTVHQQQILALKKYKRGLLQALFPANGETVPKVRFPGFTDAWEQHKLADILTEYNQQCEKDGTFEHVSLTIDGVVPKSERYERDQLVTHDDKKYRVTHVDDICYNPANLKFGVICRNKYKDGIFSPIYVTFKVNNGYRPDFIEMLVTRETFIKSALVYQQGTVYERMAVSPSDLLSMYVAVPSIDEQSNIASFLVSVDNLIILHQRKLDFLLLYKKGLLQQMLVM